MSVSPRGLHGEWAAWPVSFVREVEMSELQRNTGFNTKLAKLTRTEYDLARLETQGHDMLFTVMMFHREAHLSRLKKCSLLLLQSIDIGQTTMDYLDNYQLVEVESETDNGEKLMHRVASCPGWVEGPNWKTGPVVSKLRVSGWMS